MMVRPGGLHDVDERADERARGEVLAGAGFHVFGVLLEEAFVDVAFDVGIEDGPGFFVDEVGDEAFEFGGVLDFVLGFAEDGPEHAGFFGEVLEGAAVVDFERDAVEFDEGGPGVFFRDYGRVVLTLRAGRQGALMGHLEEEQEGELLDVIAVGEAIVAEDVAVAPEFGDKGGGVGHGRLTGLGGPSCSVPEVHDFQSLSFLVDAVIDTHRRVEDGAHSARFPGGDADMRESTERLRVIQQGIAEAGCGDRIVRGNVLEDVEEIIPGLRGENYFEQRLASSRRTSSIGMPSPESSCEAPSSIAARVCASSSSVSSGTGWSNVSADIAHLF
jgi:hypothetical protein